MKKCSKCKEIKEFSQFNKNKRKTSKDGLRSQCKFCTKLYRQDNKERISRLNKLYGLNNPEKVALHKKKYYKKNKETILIRQKERCKNNKEEISMYQQKYRKDNLEMISKQKSKWQKKHRDKINQQRKYRKQNDPLFKMSCNLRSRLNAAIKNNYKSGSAVRDLGCSIDFLKIHLEQQFQEGMTWDNWNKTGWHIDHVKPLASFDLTSREELLKACHYTNLQPLWAEENLSKGCKV